MKKILIILSIILGINCVYATDNVSFVYINGSNNNDSQMKTWYENGVKKLHPYLRKKILKNTTIKNYYKTVDGLNIKEEPVIFFWGYDSQKNLEYVKKQLELSKMVSSSGAYVVRSLIAQYLHDAIWVQKPHNMFAILDDLNETVKSETDKGNSVILFGYSAGTFVTYEYMFNKLRYINLESLFETLKMDSDFIKFVKANPKKDTCLSALAHDKSGVGVFASSGHIVINPNTKALKQAYLNLDEVTEKVCAPEGKVAGVINFASPLPLFYSDISDPEYELNYYHRLMIKYVLENGMAILTVNFKEDPLGYPSNRNLKISDLEKILDIKIVNPSGIIYDNSCVWSKRMFPFAHTAYWTAKRPFSNAIVKSIVNGYKFQYDEKYQAKVIKRKSKKSEL